MGLVEEKKLMKIWEGLEAIDEAQAKIKNGTYIPRAYFSQKKEPLPITTPALPPLPFPRPLPKVPTAQDWNNLLDALKDLKI